MNEKFTQEELAKITISLMWAKPMREKLNKAERNNKEFMEDFEKREKEWDILMEKIKALRNTCKNEECGCFTDKENPDELCDDCLSE